MAGPARTSSPDAAHGFDTDGFDVEEVDAALQFERDPSGDTLVVLDQEAAVGREPLRPWERHRWARRVDR